MNKCSVRLFVSVCLCLIAAGSVLQAKVGFGLIRKKGIDLQVRQPAAVRLANTSVAFVGASTNAEYTPVQQSLLTSLATELLSHEKSLVVKARPSDAEWIVTMDVTGYTVSQPSRRTESSGGVTTTYIRWNGSLDVAYRVLDHAGRIHDAGNVPYHYNEEFTGDQTGSGSKWSTANILSKRWHHKPTEQEADVPATPEDVKQILVRHAVDRIASKLGNTTTSVDVNVPTGEEHLDHAAEFMTNRLWSRALDELQKSSAFEKPEDESFRQYDFGLVYEAMSYQAKDGADQRADIFKAAEYYDKALELNPNEKYFVETIARTRDSMNHYKELDEMLAKDREDQDAKKKMPVAPPVKEVDVNDVIQMQQAGVAEDQLIDYIKGSNVVFNPLDKDTMIAVAKAKLSIPVQNALRAKVGAPLLGNSITAKKSK